ncbi:MULTISPECIES: division plane positioning ATPase MipZ [Pseudomonas]|uniref:division plane positioning ATPase MipZ n=1 Tax=Pseudomonas TaxID=286 RepID=UPI001786398D|nr:MULTISPECIES: division plane positioning ATPase MipZ [Pseudomonas]MBD8671633.1 chromosome partitioning protein ParA [Pseudomonas lurida]QSL90438.1 chromosome partitioning protein ParA [Pseudomonas atacamensis]
MIFVLGGPKGGVGKSCLCENLTVWVNHQGGDVALVDADPQRTSYLWAAERENNLSQSAPGRVIPRFTVQGNIREWLKEAAKRYDHIVVDTGGFDSESLRSAMTVADVMLIPFRPKRRDLKTLPDVAELVKLATSVNPDLQVRAIITQCPSLPSQVQRIFDAKAACADFGLTTLNAVTMARNVYDDADENGLSVLESDDEKAIEEINAIAAELWGDRKWRA